MSDNESHHHGKNEIIIIKRHGGDHDGAHGGAWKIAYADFMTAMMAFFLIMWLVNAANEETKAAVASYFNPIKLTDSKPAQRGLQKPAKDADGEATQDKSKDEGDEVSKGSSADDGKDKSAQAGEEIKYSEADYFENPYAVLAEIAKETDDAANLSPKSEGGASDSGPSSGAQGGEAYRDPFDPDFWTQQIEVTSAADSSGNPVDGAGLPDDGSATVTTGQKSDATGSEKEGDKKPGTQPEGEMKSGDGFTDQNGMTDMVGNAAEEGKQPAPGKDGQAGKLSGADAEGKAAAAGTSDKTKNGASDKDKNGKTDKDKSGISDKDKSGASDLAKNGKSDKDKNGKDIAAAAGLTKAQASAEKLQAQLRKELGGQSASLANGLTVTVTDEGLLVSITDQVKAPMFNVGSSVPRRETVLAMEKIAAALKDKPGRIIIRGHTDGRQYKNGEYDNWRLSTARAQSAYYMLIKGGLKEKRIGEVSGFADRMLKIPGDPKNAQNRRIEILIKSDQG